jgi:hypothetical protein
MLRRPRLMAQLAGAAARSLSLACLCFGQGFVVCWARASSYGVMRWKASFQQDDVQLKDIAS